MKVEFLSDKSEVSTKKLRRKMQKEIRYFVIFIGTSLVFFLSIVAIFLCTFNSTYGLFISFILIQPVFVTVGSSLNIKPPVS